MKILLVHNRYQQPGGEDVVFEQERKLLEGAGHQVATYCRTNDEVKGYSGVRRLTLIRNTISSEDSRREVLQLLRRGEPDVVHIHNTFMMISPSIMGCVVKRGFRLFRHCITIGCFAQAPTFFAMGVCVRTARLTAYGVACSMPVIAVRERPPQP